MSRTWKKRWQWVGILALSSNPVTLGLGLVLADKHGWKYRTIWRRER